MDWGTPWPIFNRLHTEFNFSLDAAARADNTKLPRYIGPPGYSPPPGAPEPYALDGLKSPWAPHRVWCNPPYGRALPDWLDKARIEWRWAAPVIVLLTPARPDTRWWAIAANTCSEIRFIRRRIRFQGADQGAAFPSAVLIWRPGHHGPPRYSYMSA